MKNINIGTKASSKPRKEAKKLKLINIHTNDPSTQSNREPRNIIF